MPKAKIQSASGKTDVAITTVSAVARAINAKLRRFLKVSIALLSCNPPTCSKPVRADAAPQWRQPAKALVVVPGIRSAMPKAQSAAGPITGAIPVGKDADPPRAETGD